MIPSVRFGTQIRIHLPIPKNEAIQAKLTEAFPGSTETRLDPKFPGGDSLELTTPCTPASLAALPESLGEHWKFSTVAAPGLLSILYPNLSLLKTGYLRANGRIGSHYAQGCKIPVEITFHPEEPARIANRSLIEVNPLEPATA